MARTAKAAAAPRAKGGSSIWLQGMACGAVLAFATPTALILGVLLAPAGLSAAADDAPGRPVARAVLLAGTALTLAPLWHLWFGGNTMTVALELLSDPACICAAWLAGAAAWALCQFLPVTLQAATEARAAMQASKLKSELVKLKEEWDLES